jgi:hypothetical protein
MSHAGQSGTSHHFIIISAQLDTHCEVHNESLRTRVQKGKQRMHEDMTSRRATRRTSSVHPRSTTHARGDSHYIALLFR